MIRKPIDLWYYHPKAIREESELAEVHSAPNPLSPTEGGILLEELGGLAGLMAMPGQEREWQTSRALFKESRSKPEAEGTWGYAKGLCLLEIFPGLVWLARHAWKRGSQSSASFSFLSGRLVSEVTIITDIHIFLQKENGALVEEGMDIAEQKYPLHVGDISPYHGKAQKHEYTDPL